MTQKSLLRFCIGMLAPLAFANASTLVQELETDGIWYPQSGLPGDSGNPDFWSGFTTTNNVLFGLTPSDYFSGQGGNFQNTSDGTGDITQLTNGVTPIAAGVKTNLAVAGLGDYAVFTLAAPTQLTSIQFYGGWVDGGRPDAMIDVSYSTDNGTTWNKLVYPDATFTVVGDASRQEVPVSTAPGNIPDTTFTKFIGGGGLVTNFVTISDDAGNLGGDAVITDLRFDFYDGHNGYFGIMELAAYSAVPEPATWSLVLLAAMGGGLGFVRRRRGALSIS